MSVLVAWFARGWHRTQRYTDVWPAILLGHITRYTLIVLHFRQRMAQHRRRHRTAPG